MKGVAVLPFAVALAVALAGCGGGSPRPTVTVTITGSPHATSAATPGTATANERLFVDGLAPSIPDIPHRVLGNALMRAYAQFQHSNGAAFSAVGEPLPGASVTQIAGGFKLCWPDTGNNPGCQTFTQFTTNHAGQITGVSVGGESIAGRIATAPAATSGGLTINDVVAYRVTGAQNHVAVAFKLTDSNYRPVNTSPALLASLSGASDDTNLDALPATLQPGDSLYATAGFDVGQVTGHFCLQPNDSLGERLPCTTLSKV